MCTDSNRYHNNTATTSEAAPQGGNDPNIQNPTYSVPKPPKPNGKHIKAFIAAAAS